MFAWYGPSLHWASALERGYFSTCCALNQSEWSNADNPMVRLHGHAGSVGFGRGPTEIYCVSARGTSTLMLLPSKGLVR